MEIGALSWKGGGKGYHGYAKSGSGKGYKDSYSKHGSDKGYQHHYGYPKGGSVKGYHHYSYPKGHFGKKDGFSKGKGKDKEKGKPAVELFRGYCGYCWQWGHKKSQCPNRPVKMDIGSLASASSSTAASSSVSLDDAGSSVSARVAAVTMGYDDDD